MFKRRKKGWFLYIILIGVSLFLINRFVVSFSVIPKYIYSAALYPVFVSQKYIVSPIKNLFEKRKNNNELHELVFSLHNEKERLLAENIQLSAAAEHYEKIEELVDFKKRYSFSELKLAQVIFKHINEKSHFVFVNQGSRHGIKPDMVAVYKNLLIGRVVEVYPFSSKVLLITDKSCKVASFCAKTRANGIHVGKNDIKHTSLSRVSHLSRVKDEDLILSSGEGLVFPKGFGVGKIYASKKGDLYYQIESTPLFDVKKLEYFFLVQKGSV